MKINSCRQKYPDSCPANYPHNKTSDTAELIHAVPGSKLQRIRPLEHLLCEHAPARRVLHSLRCSAKLTRAAAHHRAHNHMPDPRCMCCYNGTPKQYGVPKTQAPRLPFCYNMFYNPPPVMILHGGHTSLPPTPDYLPVINTLDGLNGVNRRS